MRTPTVQALTAILVAGTLIHMNAAGPSIGIAMASGSFRLDRAEVQGNASVFEGSEIQTAKASSRIRINSGARLELGSESRAKVFSSHAVLEQGAGQVASGTYALIARTIRVASDANASARVSLEGESAVTVSALNGPVRVTNSRGVLLAKVGAGNSLRFQPNAQQPDNWEVSGCLLKKGGKPIIVDLTTNQVIEIRTDRSLSDFGNRVTIKGSPVDGATPIAGASAVIWARSVTPVGPGGCLATAAAAGADPIEGAKAAGPAPKAPEAKPSAGKSNKAIIAGVLIGGGAAAGIGIALGGKSKSN